MNVFVLIILVYLLQRFISGFLIPLFRSSRQMRQQFHDMHEKGNGPAGGPSQTSNGNGQENGKGTQSGSGSAKVGEYIDFEEIK